MTKLDGLWADLSPLRQFLFYDGTWSNYFNDKNAHDRYKLVLGTGTKPSHYLFKQLSGGALVRW